MEGNDVVLRVTNELILIMIVTTFIGYVPLWGRLEGCSRHKRL